MLLDFYEAKTKKKNDLKRFFKLVEGNLQEKEYKIILCLNMSYDIKLYKIIIKCVFQKPLEI